MQLGGEPKRVKLNQDLTRYNSALTEGAKGTTIPDYKVGEWGSMDTFVAVDFDKGPTMDIVINSLDFEGRFINSDRK